MDADRGRRAGGTDGGREMGAGEVVGGGAVQASALPFAGPCKDEADEYFRRIEAMSGFPRGGAPSVACEEPPCSVHCTTTRGGGGGRGGLSR